LSVSSHWKSRNKGGSKKVEHKKDLQPSVICQYFFRLFGYLLFGNLAIIVSVDWRFASL
jgi:hypothetical protein